MNVHTWEIHPSTNHSATFEMTDVDVQRDSGYSVGITLTEASADLEVTFHLEASACDTNTWAIIQGSKQVLTTNDTFIYNVSQVYYKNFKVVVTFTSGSATIFAECTTKSN